MVCLNNQPVNEEIIIKSRKESLFEKMIIESEKLTVNKSVLKSNFLFDVFHCAELIVYRESYNPSNRS